MAQSKFLSEGESHFKHPIQVESENETSKQLLQIQLDEPRSQDVPENLEGNDHRDAQPGPPSDLQFLRPGKFFRCEDHRSGEYQRSQAFDQQINPPCKSGIVATRYGICFGETEKPKFLGLGNTVVVYESLQRDSQLCPPVLSFKTENGQENDFIVD